MEEVTTDTIVQWLSDSVKNKVQVSPHLILDAAQKLTILIGDEYVKLYELESSLAKMKAAWIAEGDTSAAAKAKVEAEDLWLEMKKQKGKVKQIEEYVRIAKKRATLKDNEWELQ